MQGLQDNSHQIAYHLESLAALLAQHKLVDDPRPLHEASGKLLAEPQTENWGYEIGQLKFTAVGNMAGTIPQGVGLCEIILSVDARGFPICEGKYQDPLSALQINLEINAITNSQSLYAAWHFDKHKGSTDEHSYYNHPLYHWTFGGNLMEAANLQYGECLILPTPRICYPPMDAVLAIDFVLQNYISLERRREFMDAPEYRGAVQNSQLRLWRPYYFALAAKWISFPEADLGNAFSYNALNPFILED